MKTFLKKIKQNTFSRLEVLKAPQQAGIYIFYDNSGSVLYVGKSISLKHRLISYLGKNLGPKTMEMISQAKYFSYVVVNSEIESLLLESLLVKKFYPKYNIALKDDKTPLYIAIVKDKYPWIKTARKSQLPFYKGEVFGPFMSSKSVYTVLKTLRRIFPFATHPMSKKSCFYSHLGLCNPCPAEIENEINPEKKMELVKKYKRNLRYVSRILSGELNYIKKELGKKMLYSSKNEQFEKAKYFKEKLDSLNYVTAPSENPQNYYENPTLLGDIIENELLTLKTLINKYQTVEKVKRIECYDIAHISGNFPTASMVTFSNGLPDKSLYRHFRIRQSKGNSDTDSLKEVAVRRAKLLKKWGKPDLLIVDGGKGQVAVFNEVFSQYGIPTIGIAKRIEEFVFVKKVNDKNNYELVKLENGPALYLVQKLRNEAHRFARRYHHMLFKKYLLGEK